MGAGPRRVALGIVSLALAGSMAGWGEEEPAARTRPGEPSADLELVLQLVDASGAEVQAVRQGEPVTLRLVLHNRSGAPRACGSLPPIPTTSASPSPAAVRSGAGRRDACFAQVLTEVMVEAGGSHEYRVRWSQTTSEKGTAPSGLYEVEGWIPALGAEVRGRPLAFTIQ
jgi:hypothetical protein